MKKLFTKFTSVVVIMVLCSAGLLAQNTIRGTITDADTGEGLIGANVIVAGTTTGTITDIDGSFALSTSQDLPVDLEISYTGYSDQTITATSNNIGTVSLSEGVLLTDEVVVSASRRREKVIEAPASVSVLNARKLQASPNENPARNLISMPGVTIQQQSAERINIQLRGDGGLFGSASFPIMDYRSLSGPGLGTFDAINSPLNNIDIDRIEVVRGPGSALYGPDVTSGVVHFITKSPIDKPGTTVELIGGELSTFGGAVRHATKVSDKFGFKINALYKKGGEFTLDPDDPNDAIQIARFQQSVVKPTITGGIVDATQPGTQLWGLSDLDPDGDGNMMQDFWRRHSLNATFEFRPQDDFTFNLSGGTNFGSAVFYNSQGEGLSQATEVWGQARMQKGGLFAQAFVLNSNGGTDELPTFLYQTGASTAIARTQLEAQLQYNFDTPSLLDANWTAGADFRQSNADTFNEVYGRNEQDDQFGVYGAYLQGKLALGEKLDLVLAGRVDKFNYIDDTAIQPRAVLVYKANNRNTFRFGYNRAIGSPSQLQLNIDFPVSSPVPGAFDIWLKGNNTAQTFGANPMIDFNALLGLPSVPVGTPGLPVAYAFGGVNSLVQAQLIPGIIGALTPGITQQLIAAGIPADQAAVAAMQQATMIAGSIQDYINNPTNTPQGFTGNLVGINLFNQQPLGLIDAPQAQLRTEDTWEFGYKGLLADKFGVLLDVYNKTIDGATLFTGISPSYGLLGLDNIGTDLAAGVATSGLRDHIIGLFGGAANPAAAPTADLLMQSISGAYAAGGAGFASQIAPLANGFILGAVQTEQVPSNGVVHSAAGYRTFEAYSYTGIDAGIEYYVNQDLSMFFNYSWLSDNVWEPKVVGVDGTERTSNSAPLNKYRLGFNFAPEFGWRANAAFQHDPTYEVFLGQFSGDTEERNLVDAGVGYKFDNGLSLDLTATNLFDTEYRYYPNMPKLGRRVIGRLVYEFGTDGPADADGDGVKDSKDMCPNVPGLKEFDGCPDSDSDGIIDSQDNCPMEAGDAANGGCPDSDGDGVIDRNDNCPNDAGPLNGCPDADGDGVADANDRCPNDAGTLGGCPDSDGDGVADRDDACPNSSGPVGGCPDGDGDGVADKDDKCPDTNGDGADGCPTVVDSDGDGVMDDEDKCPNTAGTVGGCPDSDGDGVANNADKCPNRGGDVNPDGCPKVIPVPAAATAVFDRALRGINFATGQAVISVNSYGILDEVASVMAQYPGLNLSIEGHTDDRGEEQKNFDLSASRAEAVMKYLITKGVDGSRMSSRGFGEYNPIADNNTATGRKQNRRVAFKASY